MSRAALLAALPLLLAPPAQGAAPVSGRVRFAPGGQPSGGALTLRLRPGAPVRSLLATVAADGRFQLDPAAASLQRDVIAAELVPAPGLPPIEGLWTLGRGEGDPTLEVTLPQGYYLRAQVEAPRGTSLSGLKLVASPGRAEAADLAEAEVEGQEAGPAERGELLNFTSYRPLALLGPRTRPVWMPEAEAYRVLASTGLLWAEWTGAPPPGLRYGAVLEAGPLALAPATGLRVTLESAGEPLSGLRLKYVRRPDSREGDALYAKLRALDPELAEAVWGDGRLDLAPGRPLLLAPLPADSQAALVLEGPSGRAAPAVEVPLRAGEVATATLRPPDALLREVREVATLRGELRWAGGGPIAGASVRETTLGRAAATSDAAGRFTLAPLPRGQTLTIALTGLPGQGERVVYQQVRVEDAEEQVAWSLPPRRWLRARELHPPGEGALPLAFFLQRRAEGGAWRAAGADAYEVAADGVDVGIDEPGHTYRVGAVWSAILISFTAPVEVGSDAAEVSVRFEPAPAGAPVLEGLVLGGDGRPEVGVEVVAVGPAGGVPPLAVRTDGSGRFRFGPANVEEVTLLCRGATGQVEHVVQPALTPVVTLTLSE